MPTPTESGFPLSRLRRLRREPTDQEVLALYETLRANGHDTSDAVSRIQDFVEGDSVELCSWSSIPALESEGYRDRDGAFISASARHASGFPCEICGHINHRDDSHSYYSSMLVCSDCVGNGAVTWSDDRDYYVSNDDPDPDPEPDEEDDEEVEVDIPPPSPAQFVLSRAMRSLQMPTRPSDMIRNYSTNPMSIVHGFRYADGETLPLNPLWLGAELEVEPREGRPRYIEATHDAVSDFCVLKRDGSLSSGGFEIVSVPATLGYHKKAWDRFFTEAAPMLRSWSTSTCGMHVHVSRAALTDLQLGKMLTFMGDENNIPFLTELAGRGSNTYSRFVNKSVTDAMPRKVRDRARHGANRYEALNTATNKPTVEFRLFRGNVSKAGFFRNLEFCDALARFCWDTSPRNLRVNDLFKWIDGRRHEYPAFTEWLVRKSLLPKARKPLSEKEPLYID